MWTRFCQLLFPISVLGVNRSNTPQRSMTSTTVKAHFTSHLSSPAVAQNLTTSTIEEVRVDMADMKIENRPVALVTNVGSCVAICIHDHINKCGGLAHIMLPNSKITHHNSLPSKYADTAVPALAEALRKVGKSSVNLSAKIAGGANMFPNLKSNSLNVGMKNVEAVKEALETNGIRLLAEDVKGTFGRRVVFNVVNGLVYVRNGNGDEKEI